MIAKTMEVFIVRTMCSNSNRYQLKFLLFVWFMFCFEYGLVQSCGDSGYGGVIAEREWSEAPVGTNFNTRSRRSTTDNIQRKACGTGNSEKIPLTRYENKTK